MGHAGAIIAGGKGTAEEKMRAMRENGIMVVDSPADMGETVARALTGRKRSAVRGWKIGMNLEPEITARKGRATITLTEATVPTKWGPVMTFGKRGAKKIAETAKNTARREAGAVTKAKAAAQKRKSKAAKRKPVVAKHKAPTKQKRAATRPAKRTR